MPAIGEPVGPPALPLGAAAACVVLAAVASILSPGRPLVAVVAWLLAGFVCVGLLTLHAITDARRRASPWYVQQAWSGPAALVVAVAAVVVVVYSSLTFALHVGRM
jgi:divalent metal cation (Fe/Co/Zn/Cd) transporter